MLVGLSRKHATPFSRRSIRESSLRSTRWLACAVLLAMRAIPAAAQYGPVDPFESSMRQLRSALDARSDGRHHIVLVGLRQLQDPQLLPLFECLLRAGHWSIRVDGVLGIAELSPTKAIDPALIEALPERTDRDNAIQAALAIKLIGPKEALEISQWDELDGRARAALIAEAMAQGAVPDRALIDKLCASKTPEIAALGEVLLLSLGLRDAAEVQAAIDNIAAMNSRVRVSALTEVSGAIVRFKLKNTGAFLRAALALPDLNAQTRARMIVALLLVDPQEGMLAWRALVGGERTQLALVRAAQLLLASGTRASVEDWALLRNQDPLLESIADAGALLSTGALEPLYVKLLATGHRSTLAAASEGAAVLGADAERALGIASLALLVEENAAASSLGDGVLRAIARLAELSPDALAPALQKSEANVPLKDLLLFALAEAGTPSAASVAHQARAGASAKGEALIRILDAQCTPTLSDADLLALSKIAGSSEPAVAAQAAWLWLRANDRATECISKLCSEIDSPTTTP